MDNVSSLISQIADNSLISQIADKMSKALEHLKQELEGVRGGRPSPTILSSIMVSYYGNQTPLSQLANLSMSDSQTLVVTPYDASVLPEVEKAINQASLGLHASVDGGLVRVPVPMLTEERRKELARHVRKLGENTKVSIRHMRREANDQLKNLEKEKQLSKDKMHDLEADIQKETDKWIETIEQVIKQKEVGLLKT